MTFDLDEEGDHLSLRNSTPSILSANDMPVERAAIQQKP
jgi:hypothetical protein